MHRGEWRARRARAAYRSVSSLASVNETPLHFSIARLVHDYMHESSTLQQMERAGEVSMEQARLRMKQSSLHYDERISQHTMRALCARDRRVVEFALKERACGLRVLQHAGILEPPWLAWGASVDAAIQVGPSTLPSNY